MNVQCLVSQIVEGRSIYPYDSYESKASLEFFIRHGHQVASDDDCYDEFLKAFPDFFSYEAYEEQIVDTLFPEKV